MIDRSADEIRAHAARFSPDPFSRGDTLGGTLSWLYPHGQYELALLGTLVREGFAANRFVHYVDNYATPASTVRYRVGPRSAAVRIKLGGGTAFLGGAPLPQTDRWIELPAGADNLMFDIFDSSGNAVIGVDPALPLLWEVADGEEWLPVEVRRGGENAPHLTGEPAQSLPLKLTDQPGIFDAGATVLGRPVFHSAGVPSIRSGESLDEALSDLEHETSHDLVQRADGLWTSVHRLGFRYLAVDGVDVDNVSVEANVRPIQAYGAFICSDDSLNKMSGVAAYTIRLCMQGLVLDGVKRDRMPWIGDQALNTLANAYTVADGAIIADGLVALGRPRHGYVNGIADYSLWWIIGQGFHQRYFDDLEHLTREADTIHEFVRSINADCTDNAIFRPRAEGSFVDSAGGVLIDWGVIAEPGRDLTALQMLWYWALVTADRLLTKIRHPSAGQWGDRARQLKATLERDAWDSEAEAWREYLDDSPADNPYPNVTAILAGLGPVTDGMIRAATNSRLGTPFMSGFALRALGMAGSHEAAMAKMSSLWLPMLDAAATTFWEEFPVDGLSPYEMYGRPFGKSLSHAWGAGPAALLPEIVLGTTPTSDGWATFTVAPQLGKLTWAAAVIVTPHGDITVNADVDRVTVAFPGGTCLETSEGVFAGPAEITRAIEGLDYRPAERMTI